MRQISRRTVLIIIAGAILALLLLLLDVLKGAFASIFPHLPLWIILVSIVVVTVLVTALSLWYERLKSTPETLAAAAAAAARESRQRILKFVENEWITGFLENRLYYSYDEQLLPLALRERVGSRFDPVLSNPLEPTQPISSDTTIMQVFDQAGGELHILGEPGAGKTTLLLELARDLLKRAIDNEAAPIPVVLMLASWATRKLPLEQWIIEELEMKYNIPSPIGKEWMRANQLLLLLDGLDEVASYALPACIEAINAYYHRAHRSLAVCSRTKEFLEQPGRLALRRAVIVQPLSSEQIDTYLDGLAAKGEEIEGLKRALHQSATLRALATTPLFLTVLILAYHGKPVQELLALGKAAPTDQPHLLFHNYVERVLQRKGTHIHAPAQQTKRWLAWLARQLTAHQQSELYLKRIQLDWLPEGQRAFCRWSIGLGKGLLYGLVSGLVAGFGYGLLFRQVPEPSGELLFVLVVGWLGGLVVWRLYRLVTGLVDGLGKGLLFGLVGGLVGWLVVVLVSEQLFGQVVEPGKELLFGLGDGLGKGLLFGLVVGLFGGLGVGLDPKIEMEPEEALTWSSGWSAIPTRGDLVGGLLFGLGTGLVGGLLFGLVGGLLFGGVGGLLFVLGTGQVGGLGTGLVGGLLFGFGYGLLGELVVWQLFGFGGGLLFGFGGGWLVIGLGLGLLPLLVIGLGETVQHYTFRFWLWRTHLFPWQVVPFLDDAVEQLLLRKVGGGYIFRQDLTRQEREEGMTMRKVGGGYIFRHRLLQDYFASLDTPPSEEAATVSASLQKPDGKE